MSHYPRYVPEDDTPDDDEPEPADDRKISGRPARAPSSSAEDLRFVARGTVAIVAGLVVTAACCAFACWAVQHMTL